MFGTRRDTLSSPQPLPRWARAADYLALVLLLVAVTVAVSGGFRTHAWDRLVILSSSLRVVAWAALVIALRHARAPQPTIVQHLGSAFVAAVRSTPFRTAAIVVLVTRPLIFLSGYLAVLLFGYTPGAPVFHDFASELLSLPLRYDAGWYLQIASEGYTILPHATSSMQQDIVFFPAFPMLVRVLGLLAGNTTAAFVIAGTMASLALFLVALVYLYLLAREDLTEDQSTAALWMIAAFPFALFYGAIYTESLYLAGAVGAFYHFRKEELGRAAIWGLIVGLTRPNGCFLTLPLALMIIERRSLRGGRTASGRVDAAPNQRGAAGTSRSGIALNAMTPAAVAAAAMPMVGVLLYSLFIAQLTGNPLAWAEGHAAWGRHYEGLGALVADKYKVIASVGVGGFITYQPYEFLNALGVMFALGSVWPVARRFGVAYAVFILINLLPPLAAGGLMSAGRFSSVLFPAFLWLASVAPVRQRAGWITVFAGLQAFNAALFYTWRPLY